MKGRSGVVSKMALPLFSAIPVITLMAIAATGSSDPTLLRERFPKLTASYEATCGAERSKVSINIKIYLFETYSLKALEHIREAQFATKNTKGKVDLSDLKRDDLSTSPYYLTAGAVKGNKTVDFENRKSLPDGILTVFATRKTLYVAMNIPEDYAITCWKNTQDVHEATGQDVLTKVKTISGNCLKVWGTVIFRVNVTKDSYKSLTGILVPDIAGKSAGAMATSVFGVYGIPDIAADESAPK